MSDRFLNTAGYLMWLVGCALFGVVAWRNDDWLSLVASTLFFVGVAVVMVPLLRRRGDA